MHEVSTTVFGYPVRTSGVSYLPKRAQAIQNLYAWRKEGDWLRDIIGAGFQQMALLALDGAPAAEIMPATAEMWAQTIGAGMTPELDRERIQKGFMQMFKSLKKWPQPVELINALPPKPKLAKLPEPEISKVDHEVQARKLQEILDKL